MKFKHCKHHMNYAKLHPVNAIHLIIIPKKKKKKKKKNFKNVQIKRPRMTLK